jgi:cathepsin B
MLTKTLVLTLACMAAAGPAPAPKKHISEIVNESKTTWTARNNDANLHKYHLGTARDAREVTKKELPTYSKLALKQTTDALPDTFDARDKWTACKDVIGNIRNQAQCGSCWAVAAASVFSDRKCITTNGKDTTSYSGLDTLSCCTGSCGNGCEGGYPSRAWNWYVNKGVVTGGSFTNKTGCKPYFWTENGQNYCSPDATSDCPTPRCSENCQSGYSNSYTSDKVKAKSAFNVPQDVNEIMTHIYNDGPLEAAFDVYNDFFHYNGGVYTRDPNAEYAGGHAVRAIGWGTENGTPYWLVANSWGTDWGLQGFFKIKRGNDECGFEEAMCAGTV